MFNNLDNESGHGTLFWFNPIALARVHVCSSAKSVQDKITA